MKYLLIAVIFLAGCATKTANVRQSQHSADQIKMVAVQREARLQEQKAKASSNEKLFDSLARVCEANPDHCPAVTVALAVIGVEGAEDEYDLGPVVQLQQQRDIGLEYAKVLAAPVAGVITGVAIAQMQSDVAKNQSNNNRKILLGDQAADAAIVQSVADLCTAAASQVGISAGGDLYQLSDNAYVDQSSSSTSSTDTFDSYNTSSSQDTNTTTTTTYEATDNGFVNTGINDHTDYIIDYQGANMSMAELIASLNAAGAAYSIDLDGVAVAESDGDGSSTETVYVNCASVSFSPKPPVCS